MKAKKGTVILKPIEKIKHSEHIFIVKNGSINEAPTEGIVHAIADDVSDGGVNIGDKVMFPQGTGITIEHEEQKYFIMRFDQLEAVIN